MTKRRTEQVDYKVKDRSGKVDKRRRAMPVNGRSVFVIQATIAKKGKQASK